jgi:pilus assembly protein CpaB
VTSRRRSFLLIGLALVLGSFAASDVASREAALERRLGPTVPVVVARTALKADRPIAPEQLGVRQVPARFAPRGTYADPAQLAGTRPSAAVPAGADVTEAALGPSDAGSRVRAGERVAQVIAAGPAALIVPGARVDVLITRGRATELALRDVEVLGAEAHETGVQAALRVTLEQAIGLADAQIHAREIRLLPRPEAG